MNAELMAFMPVSEESLKKFDLNVKDKRELIALINDSIYRKCAKTAKDRFELLDLRDKVLKLVRFETSSSGRLLVGECGDMCPEKERYAREYMNTINMFEMRSGRLDYSIMIKEYTRSSADQDVPLSNELRSLSVLSDTMLFLIDEIIPKIETSMSPFLDSDEETKFPVGAWYDFIWNRTRSIRKDIIQQRLLLSPSSPTSESTSAVTIIEQCARFHIMCAYRLCDQASEVFDFKINEENLKNCFQSLRQYYEITSRNSSSTTTATTTTTSLRPSPNEAEFRAYVILLNLSESNILSEVQRWPKAIRHTRQVRFALSVYFAFSSKNFIRFFRLVKSPECDYLQACILHRYFYQMRCAAFKSIFSAFREPYQGNREKLYLVDKLKDLLGFDDDDELNDYRIAYGLDRVEDNILIMRSTTPLSSFNLPNSEMNLLKLRRSNALVESKFWDVIEESSLSNEKCLSLIISGFGSSDYQPSRFSQNHVLQDSFSPDGYYSSDDIETFLIQAKQNYSSNQAAIPSVPSIPSQVSLKPKRTLADLAAGRAQQQEDAAPRARFTIRQPTAPSFNLDTAQKQSQPQVPSLFSRLAQPAQQGASQNPFSSILSQQPRPATEASLATSTSTSNVINFGGGLSQSSSTSQIRFPTTMGPSASTTSLFASRGQQQPTTATTIAGEGSRPTFAGIFAASANRNQTLPNLQLQQQPTTQPTVSASSSNFFSRGQQHQQQLQPKPTLTDSDLDNIFHSIYMELVKDFVTDFHSKQKLADSIGKKELEALIETTTIEQIKSIVGQEISQYRYEREQHEIQTRRAKRIDQLTDEIYSYIFELVARDFSREFLFDQRLSEKLIYDEIISFVFQTQFEIILKQIAHELNNEALLNKLAETIYFSPPSSVAQLGSNNDLLLNYNAAQNSIFINDLHSFLHACIFEFTRLNLNVNRELYYELKQVLDLNRSVYLFRKWRIKLSLKLLKKAYKTASDGTGSNSTSPLHKNNKNTSRELNCYALMSSYGSRLLSNLNRFHCLESIILPKIDDSSVNITSKSSPTSLPSLTIHSQEFLSHMAKHTPLSQRHYLLSLLYENYFNIVHDRNTNVILPLPSDPSGGLANNGDSSSSSNELNSKTIFVYPNTNSSSVENEETSRQIRRWLVKKFFNVEENSDSEFDSESDLFKRIESFSLNSLDENKYGINYVLRISKMRMSQGEFEKAARNRSLFGANSAIFVLMPLLGSNLNSYLREIQNAFEMISQLSGHSIRTVMFISYLPTTTMTESAIESILTGQNKQSRKQIRHFYCQLESCKISNNSLLSQTYVRFLWELYERQLSSDESRREVELQRSIDNVSSLADLVYTSLIKFVEFIAASCSSRRSSKDHRDEDEEGGEEENSPSSPISHHVPFKSLLSEYNERLRSLIALITRPEYKSLAWPIPELVEEHVAGSYYNSQDKDNRMHSFACTTLKYWNTEECFDGVIKSQLYDLISLDEDIQTSFDVDGSREEPIEVKQVETHIFEYLSKLIAKKSARFEGLKSPNYQLTNSVKIAVETSLRKPQQIQQQGKKSRKKPPKQLHWSNVNWSRLLLPIANFLVSNGTLNFRGQSDIYLDQFFVFVDSARFHGYDWLNNCESGELSPESSRRKLIDKYSRSASLLKASRSKRRFSPIQNNLREEEPIVKDDESISRAKKINVNEEATSEFDKKLENFMSLLDYEKRNSSLLKSKLVSSLESKEERPPQKRSLESPPVDVGLKLDAFFNQLNEEKRKNEKFNEKLFKLKK